MNNVSLKGYPIFFISLIGLLASAVLFVAFAFPKYQEYRKAGLEIEQKDNEITVDHQYFITLTGARKQLQGYQEELKKIDSALPEKPFVPSLLNFLQGLSSQSGLVFVDPSSFQTITRSELPALTETRISFSLIGSYDNLKKYLAALEKSARIIEVEKISFSSPAAGKLSTFRLEIKTFSY